jgi:hypothetical protein
LSRSQRHVATLWPRTTWRAWVMVTDGRGCHHERLNVCWLYQISVIWHIL